MNEQELIYQIEEAVLAIAASCPNQAIEILRDIQGELRRERDSKENKSPVHKINCLEDLKKLLWTAPYINDTMFRVLETGEQLTLVDLEYLYDGQKISIQQI